MHTLCFIINPFIQETFLIVSLCTQYSLIALKRENKKRQKEVIFRYPQLKGISQGQLHERGKQNTKSYEVLVGG